jgi:hypothetical protein
MQRVNMVNKKQSIAEARKLLNSMSPAGESLAYINPDESRLLKAHGGSGEITETGIPSYGFIKKAVKSVKKVVKKVVPKEISVLAPFVSMIPGMQLFGAGLGALGGFRSGGLKGALTGGLGAYAAGAATRGLAGGMGSKFYDPSNSFLGFSEGAGEGIFGRSNVKGSLDNIFGGGSGAPATGTSSVAGYVPPSGTTGGTYAGPTARAGIPGAQYGAGAAVSPKQSLLARAKSMFDGLSTAQKISLGVGSVTALAALLEGKGDEGGISNLQIGDTPGYMDPRIRGTNPIFVNQQTANPAYTSDSVFTTVPNAKDGGRIGFKDGMFVGLQGNVKISSGLKDAINSTYYGKSRDYMLEKVFPKLDLDPTSGRFIQTKANGGIIGLANGGEPSMEMDYRGGGFIPVGAQERADDVPARLSKNEFVMTADAVRAAGGGSVDVGAQRMYDLMNNLEGQA